MGRFELTGIEVHIDSIEIRYEDWARIGCGLYSFQHHQIQKTNSYRSVVKAIFSEPSFIFEKKLSLAIQAILFKKKVTNNSDFFSKK